MPSYAVIEDGAVKNIIVADSAKIAQEVTGKICVEYLQDQPVNIGLQYDGTNFIFPVIEVIKFEKE